MYATSKEAADALLKAARGNGWECMRTPTGAVFLRQSADLPVPETCKHFYPWETYRITHRVTVVTNGDRISGVYITEEPNPWTKPQPMRKVPAWKAVEFMKTSRP